MAVPLIRQEVHQWYGIEIDESAASPDVTRIGSNMNLHCSLPVQSMMRACLLNDDGTVNYYLDPADWTKKVSGAASNLDGTDGQVMIEIPTFYRKVDNPSSGIYQHKISLYPVPGFTKIDKFYVGAYKAALKRDTLKLSSVQNLTATYRGGNNNAAYDAANNTFLGKPATSISLINFRTYARNRGSNKWNVLPWRQAMIVYNLFMIEYATMNSQKAVNVNLTAAGYKQGGLGNGTTQVDGTEWAIFNGYNPVIPCGQSNSLNSGSGEVSYSIPGFGTSANQKVCRYRGMENLFGDIWEWCDGGSVFHQTDGAGGKSKFYGCNVPANFADGTAINYDYLGDLPRTEGWVKTMLHEDKSVMIPKELGGSDSTYFCDYFYTPGGSGSWVAPLRGGTAYGRSAAGFGCLCTIYSAAVTAASIGARLCYLP